MGQDDRRKQEIKKYLNTQSFREALFGWLEDLREEDARRLIEGTRTDVLDDMRHKYLLTGSCKTYDFVIRELKKLVENPS